MEFLVFVFAIAAIMWMIPFIHGGRVFRLASIVLLVGTVFGPEFFAINGPIQFSLDRFLWAGMLVIAVIQWRVGNLKFSKFTRVDWFVLAIVGYFFLSGIVLAGSGPYFQKSVGRWLFYVLMPAGMYFVARLTDIRERDIRWLGRVLVGLGVYLSVIALFELKEYHALVFPRHILTPGEFFGRGRGPLLNPIANGFIMTFGVIATALGVVHGDRRGKIVNLILMLVLFAGSYATLTRSVWIGAMLALGVIGLMYSPRWIRVLGLATAVLFAGALSLGLKDQLLSIKRDKQLSAAAAAESIELRPMLAMVAWEMFKAKPITGHGMGRYFEHNKPFHDTRAYGSRLDKVRGYFQHNTFFALAVDTGIIGLSMFLGILFFLTAIGWKLCRDRKNNSEVRQVGLLLLGTLATYVCNSMFHDMLIIPMVHMYLFFVAGLAMTIHQRGFATTPEEVPERRPMPQNQVAYS